MVRTKGEPQSVVAAVREQIHTLDPNLPVADVQTLRDQLDLSLFPSRMAAWTLGGFGVLALLLAATFCVDGLGKLGASARARWAGAPWTWLAMTGIFNTCLALMLMTRWPIQGWSVVAFVVGIRMLAAGWTMLLAREQMR